MKPVTQHFSARELHHWLAVYGWQLAVRSWRHDAVLMNFDF
jgi:hypothetical protein